MKQKKTDRKSMIMRFLKGSYLYFFLAVITSMLYTVFNSLTPQVIRAMVDSIIGTEPFSLPQPVLTLIDQIGGAFGLVLGMTGACALLLLISMVSAVTAATGG